MTSRDFYAQLIGAAIVLALVGTFAARSGLLAHDGRFSTWNLAAFCGQAYGNPDVKRCRGGQPRADITQ